MKKFSRGFTLIELMVVIAIIGILAGIILVSLNGARSNTKDTAIISDLHQLRNFFELNKDPITGSYVQSGANSILGLCGGSGFTPSTGYYTNAAGTVNALQTQLAILVADIGHQNSNKTLSTWDMLYPNPPISLSATGGCSLGGTLYDSGVIIYSFSGYDYAIYAALNNGAYACIDSSGNVISKGSTITHANFTTGGFTPLDSSGRRMICE